MTAPASELERLTAGRGEEGSAQSQPGYDDSAARDASASAEPSASETLWGWYAGRGAEPENFDTGPEPSRDAAISAGLTNYDGETFTVIEAQRGEFAVPQARHLLESWLEQWGDDDMGREDYPELEGPPAAIAVAHDDLDALLAGWFSRHKAIMPVPWAFAASRNAETFPSAEGEADAALAKATGHE